MKILVIKTSSLGDIAQALEAASDLPKASLDWVVEAPFEGLIAPYVDRTLVVHTKKWRKGSLAGLWTFIKRLRQVKYDKIIDLQGNLKSSFILLLARGQEKVGFGWSSVREKINTFFTNRHITPPAGQNIRDDYRALFELPPKKVEVVKNGPFKNVMVSSGSAWKNKQLPGPVLIDFLKLFEGKHPGVIFHFIWGTEAERAEVEIAASFFKASVILPKLSFEALSQKMEAMDLYIGMDSFPLHLAGLKGLRTISFFGPSLAAKYAPPHARAFQGKCPYGRTFEKRCPILRTCPTGACLRDQSAESLAKNLDI